MLPAPATGSREASTLQNVQVPAPEIIIEIRNVEGTLAFALGASGDSDADEDGLYDDWEEYGVLIEGTGEDDGNFIDLPAMGADPDKPDIFVHLDYMQDGSHNQRLSDAALEKVVDAFANSPYLSPTSSTGINLHIDQGPTSIMNFSTDATWGSLSQAGAIPFDSVLGSFGFGGAYNWDEFDALKQPRLVEKGRDKIFHYAVAAFRYGSSTHGSSGRARGAPSSDFIISFGDFTPNNGTTTQQAGAFMHELGHNLGLRHGGFTNENYKPNYLSVMNYSFNLVGLYRDGSLGVMDFSRHELATLDEEDLDEPDGVQGAPSNYGTFRYCGTTQMLVTVAANPIDWNCDSDATDTGVIANINKEAGTITLDGFNDWDALVFMGGAIGDEGKAQQKRALIDSRIRARSGKQPSPRVEHSEISREEAERLGKLDPDRLVREAIARDVKQTSLPSSTPTAVRTVLPTASATGTPTLVTRTPSPGGLPLATATVITTAVPSRTSVPNCVVSTKTVTSTITTPIASSTPSPLSTPRPCVPSSAVGETTTPFTTGGSATPSQQRASPSPAKAPSR